MLDCLTVLIVLAAAYVVCRRSLTALKGKKGCGSQTGCGGCRGCSLSRTHAALAQPGEE